MKKPSEAVHDSNENTSKTSEFNGRLTAVIGKSPVNHGKFPTFNAFIRNYNRKADKFPDLSKIIGKL